MVFLYFLNIQWFADQNKIEKAIKKIPESFMIALEKLAKEGNISDMEKKKGKKLSKYIHLALPNLG